MARRYNSYSPDKKLRIALEAARNEKTINQIASEHGVHACQVSEWKRQLLSEGAEIFRSRRKRRSFLTLTYVLQFYEETIEVVGSGLKFEKLEEHPGVNSTN